MTELTAPGGTSQGLPLTRLGRPAQASTDELGPLANLVGAWIGSQGFEVIAVPGEPDFTLIARPYIEVVTFEPIGAPVPDRGKPNDLFLTGLMYTMRICDRETNEPLHLEAGMWFYMEGQELEIARSSTIPHGDCLLALGNATTIDGPPTIPETSSVPPVTGPDTLPGYTDAYMVPSANGIEPDAPYKALQQANEGLNIVQTVELSASTANSGGILNIPFVDQNANASEFACTYWIETVQDQETGNQVMQLQYTQQTNINFLPQFGNPDELIMWPHVNVNTLRKQ
jgi:hypothetical protein